MAQIELVKLTTDWTPFTDIVSSPDADTTYFIQNRGPNAIVACEADAEPETQEGIIVPPYGILKYMVGSQDLYLRSNAGECSINVSNAG